jgi:hypothetical protein
MVAQQSYTRYFIRKKEKKKRKEKIHSTRDGRETRVAKLVTEQGPRRAQTHHGEIIYTEPHNCEISSDVQIKPKMDVPKKRNLTQYSRPPGVFWAQKDRRRGICVPL